jgi:hypothetical protein
MERKHRMTSLMKIINAICSGENSRSRPPLRYRSVLIALAFASLAVSPAARAVDPPPGGGYPGDNTAVGEDSLFSLTSGIHNTAAGYETLFLNSTGFNNTGIGWTALQANTTGSKNTAVGCDGLTKTTTGSRNTAMGVLALVNNTTGNGNTALGFGAGQNLTTGHDNIDIGNPGGPRESSTIRIGMQGIQGNAFIAGISGATVADGVTVVVGSDGHLGTIVSSERYKDAIQPMDKASEAILALEPVTFRYKHELDPKGIPQFGLVAEQVEKVNPDLVARDKQRKAYTVRYEAVNAMLLNEFLKEHRKVEAQYRKVEAQDRKVQELETTVTRLEAALKAQAAQIQKVSEKVELNKPAPRIVTND